MCFATVINKSYDVRKALVYHEVAGLQSQDFEHTYRQFLVETIDEQCDTIHEN